MYKCTFGYNLVLYYFEYSYKLIKIVMQSDCILKRFIGYCNSILTLLSCDLMNLIIM